MEDTEGGAVSGSKEENVAEAAAESKEELKEKVSDLAEKRTETLQKSTEEQVQQATPAERGVEPERK